MLRDLETTMKRLARLPRRKRVVSLQHYPRYSTLYDLYQRMEGRTFTLREWRDYFARLTSRLDHQRMRGFTALDNTVHAHFQAADNFILQLLLRSLLKVNVDRIDASHHMYTIARQMRHHLEVTVVLEHILGEVVGELRDGRLQSLPEALRPALLATIMERGSELLPQVEIDYDTHQLELPSDLPLRCALQWYASVMPTTPTL